MWFYSYVVDLCVFGGSLGGLWLGPPPEEEEGVKRNLDEECCCGCRCGCRLV